MRKDEKGEDGPKGSVERKSATAVREREETERKPPACKGEKKPRKKTIYEETGKGARKRNAGTAKRGDGKNVRCKAKINHQHEEETDGERNQSKERERRKETIRRVSILNICQQRQMNQSNVPFYPNNQPPKALWRVRRDKDRKERPFRMK